MLDDCSKKNSHTRAEWLLSDKVDRSRQWQTPIFLFSWSAQWQDDFSDQLNFRAKGHQCRALGQFPWSSPCAASERTQLYQNLKLNPAILMSGNSVNKVTHTGCSSWPCAAYGRCWSRQKDKSRVHVQQNLQQEPVHQTHGGSWHLACQCSTCTSFISLWNSHMLSPGYVLSLVHAR